MCSAWFLDIRISTCFCITAPPTAPTIIPTSLSTISFTVGWTITDPDHNYIVTWTNLRTGMMSSVTVPENTNSYMVTGLNDMDNYNVSVTANNSCGMTMSDPTTVYGKKLYMLMYVLNVCTLALQYVNIICSEGDIIFLIMLTHFTYIRM